MRLQKSDLCTAVFLGVASPARPLPLALYGPGAVPAVSRYGRVVCLSAVPFPCLLLSPAVFLFPLPFAPLISSTDPLVPSFLTAAGVGPRQQWIIAVSEFVG